MITTKKIEYYITNVYGNETCYIADKHIREVILNMTGKKVLTSYIMESLKELGFELVEVLKIR